ncbi:sugar phosphate isomerase/epimerase [Catenovulum sp. 2E275]|uniref:sugar phosphate isomerase/epimerase family protein n=1 Tax=Catenovulum sp. 2E275 TaxID=2980497 RepID=UPI0021D08D7A|nr:sugar phosphate isomerase/epimerase [Catenovulum sp. 2E275]MCU4674141.1 sugar phosphate isomerase/epimerase [Catenovulum sp. 2E275]
MNQYKKLLSALCISAGLIACQQAEAPKQAAAASTDKPVVEVSHFDEKIPPISVQLWSVRDDVKSDFKGTLTRIAAMGFKGVEFAGEFGPFKDDPQGLKQFLAELSLKPSGAHVPINQLQGDNYRKTIDFLTEVGVNLFIIPIDGRAWDPEKIAELTNELTELTQKLSQEDLYFGYHNHAEEFGDFNDQTFWDYIAQNTPENMVLQMDVGWVNFAGKDPIHYVKAYPERTMSTHIKIRTPNNTAENVIIGQDSFDWAELVKTDILHGGIQWLVIEQEEYPQGLTPMNSIKASKAGLEKHLEKLTK